MRWAYVDQISLVSHVQVVDDGGLVQVRQLGHVAGLVELGWVDFVDGVGVDLLLRAILALHQQPPARALLDDPAPHEGALGVVQPDIALAGEVVLALDDAAGARAVCRVLGDELRGEGAYGHAVAVGVGAQAGLAAAQGRADQMCERLVPCVGHLELCVRRLGHGERSRGWCCAWRRRCRVPSRKGAVADA